MTLLRQNLLRFLANGYCRFLCRRDCRLRLKNRAAKKAWPGYIVRNIFL